MKPSTRAWIAAALVLALSLCLKVAAYPAWSGEARPTSRTELLRRFLESATDGPLQEIAAPANSTESGGWRFGSGACQTKAFPSGPRGSLDMFAKSHARRSDQIAYVYRGEVQAEPPTPALAMDVIVHRLTTVFRPTNEPGYVVLIYPKDCSPPSTLPWAKLPAS
ncbi:MAG: hypothetical protein ACREE0_16865 [Phenylobacterium sp.]